MYLVAIGEIFLKGKNRITFERRLIKNIREALNLEPNDLIKFRNRYLIAKDTKPDNLSKIFGIIFYVKCIKSNLESMDKAALSLIKIEKTFRISAKKSISLKKSSQTLNEEIGSYIVSKKTNLKVSLENPEIDIRVEELDNKAFLYKASDKVDGLGGLPIGTGGFVHLRTNNELNSTVAGFLLMKRGCVISLSKELPLLHKFGYGFKLKTREEKEQDIVATDETFENIELKQDEKFTLRPLIGYTEKEIKEIYNKIKFI